MKKLFAFIVSLFLSVSSPALSSTKGYLFVIGGGSRSESMMKRFVELSKRFNSGKIIVFPMASSVPAEVGPEQAEQLKQKMWNVIF